MLWIWEILPSFSTNFHVLPQFENIAQNSSTLVTLLGFRSFSCLPLLLCEFAQLLVLFDRGYSKVGSTIWTENMFVFSVHVFHVAAQIFCPSGTQIAQCLLNLLSFPIVLVNVVFQSIFVAKWFWANVAQEIFWWPLLCSVSNHVSLQNVLVGKRFWAHIAKCPFNCVKRCVESRHPCITSAPSRSTPMHAWRAQHEVVPTPTGRTQKHYVITEKEIQSHKKGEKFQTE